MKQDKVKQIKHDLSSILFSIDTLCLDEKNNTLTPIRNKLKEVIESMKDQRDGHV